MRQSAPVFELNPRIAPVRAVRQAALAQIDHALAGLQRGDDQAIHEARKVCKKLRALLRLIRPYLGRAYRAENRRLRDVGRSLSHGRNAAVLRITATRLFGDNIRYASVLDAIRGRPAPELAVSLTEAKRLLQTQRRRVAEWPLRALAPGGLMVGLLGGYRAARQGYRSAARKPAPVALHEWRKQAKYHGYQWALMRGFLPNEGRSRIRELKRLSDRLGEHHDLTMLAAILARRPGHYGGREAAHIARARITDEQDRKTAAALALGRALFRHKPLDWLAAEAIR
jgi:CHAD domain-containing protein